MIQRQPHTSATVATDEFLLSLVNDSGGKRRVLVLYVLYYYRSNSSGGKKWLFSLPKKTRKSKILCDLPDAQMLENGTQVEP